MCNKHSKEINKKRKQRTPTSVPPASHPRSREAPVGRSLCKTNELSQTNEIATTLTTSNNTTYEHI